MGRENLGRGWEHLLLLEGFTGVHSVGRCDDFRLVEAWCKGPQHAAVAHAEEHLIIVFLDELELIARSPAGLLWRVLVAQGARAGCRLAVDWRRRHVIGDVPEGGSRRGRSEGGHGGTRVRLSSLWAVARMRGACTAHVNTDTYLTPMRLCYCVGSATASVFSHAAAALCISRPIEQLFLNFGQGVSTAHLVHDLLEFVDFPRYKSVPSFMAASRRGMLRDLDGALVLLVYHHALDLVRRDRAVCKCWRQILPTSTEWDPHV